MSIFDSIFSWLGVTLHAGDLETMDILMDVDNTPTSAMQLSAVHSAVKGISETVSSLPIQISSRKNGVTEPDKEDYRNILLRHRPNKTQTPTQFWDQIMGSALLRGKCPVQIIRDGLDKVVQLCPLNPDRMKYFTLTDGSPAYLYKDKNGTEHRFIDADIMMIENFLGMSPIALSSQAFDHAATQQKHSIKFIKNGMRPSGVVTREKPWAKDGVARKKFIEGFKEAYAGAAKSGGTILLEDGMDWKAISINADESQFLESRKYSKEEILSIFRYPPHLAGDMTQMKFANVSQMFRSYLSLTILPWLKRIEQALERSVFTDEEFDTVFPRFNIDSLMRAEYKDRMLGIKLAVESGHLTPNEGRGLEDLPPLPGGDQLRGPVNMAPLVKQEEPDDEPIEEEAGTATEE